MNGVVELGRGKPGESAKIRRAEALSAKVKPLQEFRVKFTDTTFRLNQFLALNFDLHAEEIVEYEQHLLFIVNYPNFLRYKKKENGIKGILWRRLQKRPKFVLFSKNLYKFLVNFLNPIPVEDIVFREAAEASGDFLIGIKVRDGFYGRAVGTRGVYIKIISRYFSSRYPVSAVVCFESDGDWQSLSSRVFR